MNLLLILINFLIYFILSPLYLHAQEVPMSEDEMVALINSSYGKAPLYEGKDIPDKHLHTFDFNDDSTPEWVVVPEDACGETKNCTFFIMQYDEKSKHPGWKLLLMADGKVTPTTPWGFAKAPRKTKGYLDIVAVFDEGPAGPGQRILAKHYYVWDGNKYVEYTQGNYPPDKMSDEMKVFLEDIDKLKFQRTAPRQSPKQIPKKSPSKKPQAIPTFDLQGN